MLASEEVVKHILSHHGVLGMKWGVHRSGGSGGSSSSEVKIKTRSGKGQKTTIRTSGGKNLPPHPDAVAAKVVTQKLKKSGLHVLSNQELQTLATRTNLENQINRSGVGKSTIQKGYEHATAFAKTPEGKVAVGEIAKAARSTAGKKAISHLFKGAAKAAVA